MIFIFYLNSSLQCWVFSFCHFLFLNSERVHVTFIILKRMPWLAAPDAAKVSRMRLENRGL